MLTKAITTLFRTKPKTIDPVQWRFAVNGGVHNIYNVHITGFMADNWRIAVEGSTLGGPLPTAIEFEKSAFVHLNNAPKVMGHKKEAYSETYNTTISYCTNIVNFVQELHALSVPTTLRGTILYMPFTDKQCLDLMEHPFAIELGMRNI